MSALSMRPTMTSTSDYRRFELDAGGWIELWPRLIQDHDRWMTRLLDELALEVETYRIAGRTVSSPRLVGWYGDSETEYTYSGSRHVPQPWTPGMIDIRGRIETTTELRFNAVLANLYRDGRDGMGWHADAEPQIGPSSQDRWIASLSLGASRRFVLRHRRRRDDQLELELGEGDLLVMRGTTQSNYRHAVPKTSRPIGPRLNLTFRHII